MSRLEFLPPCPAKSSRWRRGFSAACLMGIVVGTIAQLTFRDWYPFPWSGLFYASPRPLLLVLAVIGLAFARARLFRALWILIVLALAGWVSQADIAWNANPSVSTGSESIVFWNVGHDLPDDVEVVERFLARKPAVLGLVETGDLKDNWLALWREKHPDYQMVTTFRGLLVAVRGKVMEHHHHKLAHNSPAFQVKADLGGQIVHIFLVDIAANPWISRREAMTKLAEILRSDQTTPTIVMGDFNAPDDSAWFEPLRPQFREVFRTAGRGYAPTWPWPAPILKLDHIWVNDRVTVSRAWQQYSWHSDHRTQWAEVSFGANRQPEDEQTARQ